MGFSRQEYWGGLSCPPLGDLPDPGIERVPLKSLALAGRFFTTSATWEAWSQNTSSAKIKQKNTGRDWAHTATHVAPGAQVKESGWLTLEGYGDW